MGGAVPKIGVFLHFILPQAIFESKGYFCRPILPERHSLREGSLKFGIAARLACQLSDAGVKSDALDQDKVASFVIQEGGHECLS